MAEIKKIHLNKLLLDLDNPRYPEPPENEAEAIEKMILIQDDKIVSLAKDIIENGLDPSENLMVIESDDEPGCFTVCEGNRRLTVLKILKKPALVKDPAFRNRVDKLLKKDIKIPAKINCAVFDDEAYEHWITLKHTGENSGAGRVKWGSPEKERFDARLGYGSYQNQLMDFIAKENRYYKDIIKKKNLIKITNIKRLLDDPFVRTALGIVVEPGKRLFCNQPKEHFLSELNKILELMVEADEKGKSLFTVDRIRFKKDRENLIKELDILPSENSVPIWGLVGSGDALPEKRKPLIPESGDAGKENNLDQRSVKDPEINDTQKITEDSKPIKPNARSRNNAPDKNRNYLIPSYVTYSRMNFGENKKCNRIFFELKRSLNFDDSIYSISVMLRVFIDLSVTSFIEKNKIKRKNEDRDPGLHDKVVMCSDFLKSNGKLTQSQVTAVNTCSKDITKAKGSLQQYVHNSHFNPTKEQLNTEWDNFEPLLLAIWSSDE